MKKTLTLFLCAVTLVASLSSCGEKRKELDSDFQPNFTTIAVGENSSMVAAEGGYYVRLMDLTWFISRGESLKPVVFCPNPTCRHNAPYVKDAYYRCIAQEVGHATGALQYYNGELYYKNWDKAAYTGKSPTPDRLFAVKTDGTGLHIIQDLWTIESDPWPDENTGSNFDYPFAILGDTIMFCPRSHMICVGKLGGAIEDARTLFSYDSGDPTVNHMSAHWMIWVDGGYFYYCGVNCPDGVVGVRPSFLVYRYDPLTEENKLIWRADEMTDTYTLDGFYIKDGVFYYYIAEHELEKNETGVWKCDLETHETVKLTDCDEGNVADFDGEYAYIQDNAKGLITVLGQESGEIIATLNFGAAASQLTPGRTMASYTGDSLFRNFDFMGGDDQYLFVAAEFTDPNRTAYDLFAIEKDSFAQNDWTLVIDYERGKVWEG